MILFKQEYSGESLIDAADDVAWAIDDDISIPRDKDGMHQGKFRITIEWFSDTHRVRTYECNSYHGDTWIEDTEFATEEAARAYVAEINGTKELKNGDHYAVYLTKDLQ